MAHATSTQADLNSAQAQLDSMNRKLDLLVEQYDQTNVQLQTTQTRLARQRVLAARAQAQSQRMHTILTARAVAAYEGGAGSELEVVLGATSMADLTDRLEFMNSVVKSDAQVAAAAQAARLRAQSAEATLSTLAHQQQSLVNQLGEKKAEIESSIAEQQTLVDQLKTKLAKEQAAAAAAAAAKKAAAAAAAAKSSGSSGGNGGGPSPQPSPSPSSGGGGGGGGGSGASAAVAAAFSVIGVPYQWGGSDPQTGFDCSGLTMWSWAHGGVSLPHSAADQYSVIPHVSKSDLEPGDLLFFYTPISHVSIYVGGGMQIEAPHTGSYVMEDAVYWQYFVGAGRP